MTRDYTPQAWRFGDGPNQFYADQYATTSTRLDYDLDYDESRFNQRKTEFLADLAAHDAEVTVKALRDAQALIKGRREHMARYDAPVPYQGALSDAWGLIANRIREIEPATSKEQPHE